MTTPERSTSPGVPVNPKLPPHDGSTADPSLWLRQVKTALEAYNSPADQHLRGLVLAIRCPAVRCWFFEVEQQGQVPSTYQFLQLHVQRLRPYTQSYHIQQQLNALLMQPGSYLLYSDSFLEIATQQHHLSPKSLLNVFISGLTAYYRTACCTYQVSDICKAQELCRAMHFAIASTQSTTLVSSLRTPNRRVPSRPVGLHVSNVDSHVCSLHILHISGVNDHQHALHFLDSLKPQAQSTIQSCFTYLCQLPNTIAVPPIPLTDHRPQNCTEITSLIQTAKSGLQSGHSHLQILFRVHYHIFLPITLTRISASLGTV